MTMTRFRINWTIWNGWSVNSKKSSWKESKLKLRNESRSLVKLTRAKVDTKEILSVLSLGVANTQINRLTLLMENATIVSLS